MKNQNLSDDERELKEWKKERFKHRCYTALSFAPLLLSVFVKYVSEELLWLIAVSLSVAIIRAQAVGGKNAAGICGVTAFVMAFFGISNLYPYSKLSKDYIYEGMLMLIVGIGYLILFAKYTSKNKE